MCAAVKRPEEWADYYSKDVMNVTQQGMLLIVYDGVNDEIADIALLERDSGYTFKHLYNS